jgi:FkbH-like protein
MQENRDLRHQINEHIDQKSWAIANLLLGDLLRQELSSSTVGYILPRYERLCSHLPLVKHRLAILRSFTVEPIVPLLRALGFANGIDLTVQIGDFNTYTQEILDKNSNLYRFEPDTVILAIQTRDIAPKLWAQFADFSATEVMDMTEQIIRDYENLINVFRSFSRAHLVVHCLELPVVPAQGILDNQIAHSQIRAVQEINQELRNRVGKQTGIYILDYDGLIARYGRIGWHDERKWLTMRMPISADNLISMAKEWMRFIHPLSGKISKALVVDLDNTLWGGVIGEDGMTGIKLSQEYPGAIYQSLQRVILDLYQRGIILAICSKNNYADAMEVIEKHPGMLLKPQNFAALRINWNDKVQNLRGIATELNIGIESLAFLDDNPVERQRVRTDLPEVTVIDLPENPAGYAQALQDSPVFERLALSKEDRERGRYYAEQRQRAELEQSATSMDDFYRSLQQELEIAPISTETLARAAQLTQKTNQFNLTTRRYSEQQIAEMASSSAWQIYSLRVQDRFGDNGLVGIAILHFEGETCELDTLLLSCRVIGRTVETSFLGYLIQKAQERGSKQLQGWFVPTKKNAPAENFYHQHGFQKVKIEEKGTLWSLDLKAPNHNLPDWNRINIH